MDLETTRHRFNNLVVLQSVSHFLNRLEKESKPKNGCGPCSEDILLRLRANLTLKIALSSALTIGAFGVCLFLQRHPLFQVTTLDPT